MTDPRVWIPYCGAAPTPAEWLARWTLDPVLLAALALVAIGYARIAKVDRSARLSFWAGWSLVVLLFVSPLCALSSALFSVRVLHHAVLATLVAPLLARALPDWRPRSSLATWTAAHLLTIWFWHAPPAYAWALSASGVFWAMQLSILAAAIGFWSAVARAPAPAAAALLFVAMTGMGLLGALITFAPTPLYAPHLIGAALWGWNPLEDQQLAGLIMWIPASIAYLAAALWRLGGVQGDARPAQSR